SNESAFKTARFYWKAKGKPDKVKIIARVNAYHGVTLQAMSATGMAPYWKMFEPRVPNFVHIPTCYPYRQDGAKPGESAGQTAARLLEEAILREGPDTVAAFIAEPIHGGGGVLYPTDDYFPLVRQVCDRHNVLFIADEVITGFCRTGRWFALDHWNVLPDMVSFAKGVSSGYLPLGGIMVSKAIKQAMDEVKLEDRWMHAYTYSGHPTCCAVGLKNIEIMERERLWERAAAMGTRLYQGLRGALADHKHVGDIRGGKGLLAAVELVEDRATKTSFAPDKKIGPRVLQEMTKRGVVTRGRLEHIFFAPPLVISEAEVDRLVSVATDAVKAATGA
ncbi:MAG TPA: aminotransferase class III-fold pyridoxal phosphate-dependent enzyme, partial [Methylomirabilota bacterium]|nr:aminotransferase class III-fold pyridoxal phosphate-dependent enzyme [Methylomirabilota bacterium]